MKITDEKWDEIITETQARIARWNARALEHGVEDTFTCDVERGEKYAVLITRHLPSERKAVARELATGELRKATTVTKRGKLVGFSIKTPDPKAWRGLADKPAAEIVRKLKLTDYWIVKSVSTPTPAPVVGSSDWRGGDC